MASDSHTIVAIPGGVTAPGGFLAAGVACGIKASGRPDLALLVAAQPASAAGVFTENRAAAAPVRLSRAHLAASGGRARAIVTNSGCANACTGPEGDADAREMAVLAARLLGADVSDVLVASTGVIGVRLPMEAVRRGIHAAVATLAPDGGAAAAAAILTTDTGPKTHAVEVSTPGGRFRVGGMAKGAGMIAPRLATMLAYLTTDAAVEPAGLHAALVEACRDTFNAITVDGEPSTNDSVFALASGASSVTVGRSLHGALVAGLRAVAHELALAIVRGGEGATKLVRVVVTGAISDDEARLAARAIATSLLVKTALHGGDPNWGRLIAAAGRSGAALALERAHVRIGPHVLFEAGQPFDDRAPTAAAYLRGAELEIEVGLGTGGGGTAAMYTCDLSAEYVRINAEYRT